MQWVHVGPRLKHFRTISDEWATRTVRPPSPSDGQGSPESNNRRFILLGRLEQDLQVNSPRANHSQKSNRVDRMSHRVGNLPT